jgi:ABC-2 type transport system ATP-binding protein
LPNQPRRREGWQFGRSGSGVRTAILDAVPRPRHRSEEAVVAVIEVANLTKRYAEVLALDGVSFTVEQGEIFGVLGPNGAGKTTAVECAAGLRVPDGGSIRVLGLDPRADGTRLREQVGVQLQESHLPDQITVSEALELYAAFYRNPLDWRALLETWGLAEKRRARFAALSGGQRQRLFIALALVGNPQLVFLDELTTGLDPQARRATWQLIRQVRDTGVTVVLVSHLMDEVEELCDRLILLEHGKVIASDTPSGLIERAGAPGRLRFRPLGALPDTVIAELGALPGVEAVDRAPREVGITGTGDFAVAVTATLARAGVLVADLRIDRHSLDDAYLALTGRPFASVEEN